MGACRKNSDCSETGNCSEGVCKNPSREGDFCSTVRENCPGNLKCEKTISRCVDINFDLKAPCQSNLQCSEGHYCHDGSCKVGQSYGYACSAKTGCRKDLECYMNECMRRCLDDNDCFPSWCESVEGTGFKVCLEKSKNNRARSPPPPPMRSSSNSDAFYALMFIFFFLGSIFAVFVYYIYITDRRERNIRRPSPAIIEIPPTYYDPSTPPPEYSVAQLES